MHSFRLLKLTHKKLKYLIQVISSQENCYKKNLPAVDNQLRCFSLHDWTKYIHIAYSRRTPSVATRVHKRLPIPPPARRRRRIDIRQFLGCIAANAL